MATTGMVRSERMELRLSARQREVYGRAAAAEGITVSEWLRWTADRRAAESLGMALHPVGPVDR